MNDRSFHCGILGVTVDASLADIKKAYREAASLLHPDKHNNSEAATRRFQQLNESYQFLLSAIGTAAPKQSSTQPEPLTEEDWNRFRRYCARFYVVLVQYATELENGYRRNLLNDMFAVFEEHTKQSRKVFEELAVACDALVLKHMKAPAEGDVGTFAAYVSVFIDTFILLSSQMFIDHRLSLEEERRMSTMLDERKRAFDLTKSERNAEPPPMAPTPPKKAEASARSFRILQFLIVAGLTGYVYKLYLNGATEAFIEKARRQPTYHIADVPGLERKPVGECSLNVRSTPPGAEVFEGNQSRGFTPLVLSGPCHRSVNIVLRKVGYEYLSENVVIGPKFGEWSRALRPIPMGRLALNLGFNAEVYLNGEKARDAHSRVPLEIPLRAKRTYELRLANRLLNVDVKSDVLIEEGQQTAFNLSLDEASARSRTPTTQKKR